MNATAMTLTERPDEFRVMINCNTDVPSPDGPETVRMESTNPAALVKLYAALPDDLRKMVSRGISIGKQDAAMVLHVEGEADVDRFLQCASETLDRNFSSCLTYATRSQHEFIQAAGANSGRHRAPKLELLLSDDALGGRVSIYPAAGGCVVCGDERPVNAELGIAFCTLVDTPPQRDALGITHIAKGRMYREDDGIRGISYFDSRGPISLVPQQQMEAVSGLLSGRLADADALVAALKEASLALTEKGATFPYVIEQGEKDAGNERLFSSVGDGFILQAEAAPQMQVRGSSGTDGRINNGLDMGRQDY